MDVCPVEKVKSVLSLRNMAAACRCAKALEGNGGMRKTIRIIDQAFGLQGNER